MQDMDSLTGPEVDAMSPEDRAAYDLAFWHWFTSLNSAKLDRDYDRIASNLRGEIGS